MSVIFGDNINQGEEERDSKTIAEEEWEGKRSGGANLLKRILECSPFPIQLMDKEISWSKGQRGRICVVGRKFFVSG